LKKNPDDDGSRKLSKPTHRVKPNRERGKKYKEIKR
jgi:hypothetical protein